MCNSVNLKPGRIIKLLLKIVNILRMATNQLDMATAESAWSVLFIKFDEVSKKVLCA